MSSPAHSEITDLLCAWSTGDNRALDRLMPLVHERLRRLASSYLRHERSDHTLQTLALVNEAYLRLTRQNEIRWQDRSHFFAIVARTMRRILVDHARSRGYQKRGGDLRKLSLEGLDELDEPRLNRPADLVALDDALIDLHELDPQMARLVELRFFGGLSKYEIAEVLGISSATVTRRWRVLKAWLYQYLVKGEALEL